MVQLLKTSNQKYRLLSENITDGIFICRDGNFEYANKAMNRIFGYNDRELVGLNLAQLVTADYSDKLEIFNTLKAPSNKVENVEVECQRKDFSVISV
jgi:PAS domain S-box-containing protein